MTYTWGVAKSSESGNAAKVGLEASVSVVGTTATVTWPAGMWTRWTCDDSANSWAWSGAVSGAGSNHTFTSSTDVDISWDTRNQRLNWTSKSASYDLTTQGGTTKTATLTLSNIDVAGGQDITVSLAVVLPYVAPAAPSSGAAGLPTLSGSTWSSPLSWTITSTSPAPVTNVKVTRWDSTRAAGSYITVATLGAVSSYVDNGLAPDRRYAWAVQATNSGGASAWHYFGDRYTAPASPTSHTAARSGSGIAGSFVTQSTVNPAFEVWDSTDGGGTWAKVLDIAAATRAVGATVTYTLSSVNQALPHLLRVKAVIGGQSSGWATIPAAVVIITKPNPPTPSPSGGAVDAASGVTLTATPSATVLPDGSNVTGRYTQYRIDGGAWVTTGPVAVSSLSLAITPGNGHTIEHQWRVKGAHADYSEWSPVASFKTSGKPVSTITGPATVTGSTLTLEFGGTDPEGQPLAAVRVGLEDAAGAALVPTYETAGGTLPTSYTYPVALADGQTVVAWVQHQDADGVWSTRDTETYTVAYVGPTAATVTATWAASEPALILSIDNTPEAGLPAVVSQDVHLVEADGSRTLVAAGLAPFETIAYRRAPLVETVYEVTTYSALPSATVASVTVPADPEWGCRVVVSGGPGYSLHASVAYNVDIDRTAGRSRVLVGPYVGYAYPDEVVTESLTDSRTVSGAIFAEDAADFDAVQTAPDPLWYRDPLGASWPCSVQWPRLSISDHLWPRQVSLVATRIGSGPLLSDPQESGIAPVSA